MMKRFIDNQIKNAAADLAAKISKDQILAQITYYNKPKTISNSTQLDDLYVHQYALRFKD